ncbi:hypothetical protein QBC37DRAFT_458986 [Rhypophila decipiens]|uniref:Extracellular membrane protein CFEM domain-containing protein n=1 Tax=Rhypophila decipiens TaxID=261697 RepID=A0AAN6YCD0_9PEZI|nr:hypothetical protein QBC37DRAFT_458986 [Rhypophila decipiens]
MISSSLYLISLHLLLTHRATANSAATCVTPISGRFSAHPECAQSCLGCTDSNESFAHVCELDSSCCQGDTASLIIPLVYSCVKTTCSESEAQKSWEVFSVNCGRKGVPVDEADTPSGYLFVSASNNRGTTTRTTEAVPGTTSLSGGDQPSTITISTSPTAEIIPPAEKPGPNDGSSSTSKDLGTGEIVGIALGAVSALAAVIGLGLRWKHLQLAKKNGTVIDAEAKI